jgi:hypothetical protein
VLPAARRERCAGNLFLLIDRQSLRRVKRCAVQYSASFLMNTTVVFIPTRSPLFNSTLSLCISLCSALRSVSLSVLLCSLLISSWTLAATQVSVRGVAKWYVPPFQSAGLLLKARKRSPGRSRCRLCASSLVTSNQSVDLHKISCAMCCCYERPTPPSFSALEAIWRTQNCVAFSDTE